MTKNALILFVRNPVLGKVKTRLAATLGDAKALEIYRFLLKHTHTITEHLDVEKFVFYADFIGENDCWNSYHKEVQVGKDLGEKMQNAFQFLFEKGAENICIIGSDCYALSAAILTEAFNSLEKNEVVIGPATDGGYYLLGMKKLHGILFKDIAWSSATVLQETKKRLETYSLTYHLLPALNDVDEASDIDFDWNGS